MTIPSGADDGIPPHGLAPGSYSARDEIAAQRAAAARQAQARTRLVLAAGVIIAVVAVVVAFVIVKVLVPRHAPQASASAGSTAGAGAAAASATGPGGSSQASGAAGGSTGGLAGAALQAVVAQVTSVPAAAFSQVGKGSTSAHPNAIGAAGGTPAAPPLVLDGKPEMVYLGAEFCPYCAAERWAMITALSRFGTFTGLAAIKSATYDGAGNQEPYGGTSTWTFVHATYTSTYVAFTPVEMNTNVPDPSTGGYTTLEKPTAAQQALLGKYDAAPYVPSADAGAIPFVDYGGKYLSIGASYDPGVLQGLAWAQIATDLHDPASAVAKGVLGTANFMTAALCELTGNQPAAACTPTVRSLQSQL